jgi:dolichol kinase
MGVVRSLGKADTATSNLESDHSTVIAVFTACSGLVAQGNSKGTASTAFISEDLHSQNVDCASGSDVVIQPDAHTGSPSIARPSWHKQDPKKASTHKMVWLLMLGLVMITIPIVATSMITYPSFWFTLNPEVFWLMAITVASVLTAWYITAGMRLLLLRKCGFSVEERSAVFSRRNHQFPLQDILQKHSKFSVRLCDGIPRKANHIITSLYNLLFIAYYVKDDTTKIHLALLGQVINLVVSLLVYRSRNFVSFAFYGSSSRIRDGRFGRLNLVIVRFVGLLTLLALSGILSFFRDQIPEQQAPVLLSFIFIPTALGDAAGEIVGSLFGRLEFTVWGIGEVNKKTLEGTSAVFIFSLVPMIILAALTDDVLVGRATLLALIISTSSTLMELFSARGTDNFTLPVTNALLVWMWVSNVDMFEKR